MRLGLLRLAVLTCALGIVVPAQTTLTVEKLVEFIKSSIKLKLPDKEVAADVAGLRLSQKLEDQTIEDLQTAGAGLRTVAALTKLADQSAKLAAPPPPPASKAAYQWPAPPSSEERARILREVREYALNYTQSLPNFLCVQVTRRSVNMHPQPGADPSWTPTDRLIEKLSFVDHRESYEIMDGRPWEKVGGAMSRGEWASLMGMLFEAETATDFQWERWTSFGDGKFYHVFKFSVDKAHSRQTLEVEGNQRITPAYHGEIFIPADASVVWRIKVIPDIPADFPMQDVQETLKYNYVDINGQRFLLPLSSDVTLRTGRVASHNEIDFRRYQKYSADTKLIFDDVEDAASVNDKNDKKDQKETGKP